MNRNLGGDYDLDVVAASAECQPAWGQGGQSADHGLVAARRQRQFGQWVGKVRVDAELGHHHVRPETLEERWDQPVESPKVDLVVGPGRKRQVDSIAFPCTAAGFFDLPRAGKQRPSILVKRDGQDPVGIVEGILDAVAVVNVDIDVRHPLALLEEPGDGDRGIVVDAEARGVVAPGVVETTAEAEGHLTLPPHQQVGAAKRGADGLRVQVMHAGEHRVVTWAEIEPPRAHIALSRAE